MACFCLTSVLPILAGVYVASLFIKFPFEVNPTNLLTVSLVSVFSILLSLSGFYITRQMMTPITNATTMAHKIAAGDLEGDEVAVVSDPTDEIQDLSRSLRVISKNAKELLDKVEKLSLKDKLTGLYNATYIRERLDEEIQRAIHYQRPCSFVYLMLAGSESEYALKQAAQILRENLREFDRAARIGACEFGLVFPDINKKKAIEIMEKISQEIGMTIHAGISENPMDGVQADALYVKAQDRMKTAKVNGKATEAFA